MEKLMQNCTHTYYLLLGFDKVNRFDVMRHSRNAFIHPCKNRRHVIINTEHMKKDRTWDSFLNVLCIYYDVPPVFARVNKRISAVAHYIEAINLIETKEEIVGMRTILHEFFHHLISKRRSLVPRNTDETLADSYADACMKLLQER